MKYNKIWLSSPHMGGHEQKFVQEAFDTNWIAPLGPNVSGFEKDLEEYLGGNNHVAALSSGTAALHLALVMAGVTAGDEVICQSFTFCGSANPILYQGAVPVFVDSENETWNICPVALEDAIKDRISKGKKPKAIIVVHLYGMPCKMDEVLALAKAYNIKIIEDAAEALGSTYKGRKCGTLGDYGVLSFNGNKIITTSGGGALVCNSKEEKEKTVFLATQARDQAPHYEHSELGFNYRMSNITAGIGRGQMMVLDRHIELRRKMNVFYRKIFLNTTDITVQNEPGEEYHSNFWLSAIITNSSSNTKPIILKIKNQLENFNIECRPLWKPMHLQPLYGNYNFYKTGVSERLFNNGLCLPSGSNLSIEERDRIHEALIELDL